MATRQETAQQRATIEDKLRQQLRRGTLSPGESVPSVRAIAQQFGVSVYIAHCALKTLADEGAFQSTRGRGTFVGRRERSRDKRFLIVTDYGEILPMQRAMQTGFEDRIAELGGVSGLLNWESLVSGADQISVAGIFHLTSAREDETFAASGVLENLARVRFADKVLHGAEHLCDLVSFDDFGGGLQATDTLLGYGHERIAFLGFHARQHQSSYYGWSAQREQGWLRALENAGIENHSWSFLPTDEPSEAGQIESARGIAVELLRVMRQNGEPFAVVCANDRAALGLIATLEATNIERAEWPAIVGFDSCDQSQKLGLTSLRLPWESIGHAAAELVWNRSDAARGAAAPPQHEQIEMRLITRTSCARGWAQDFAAELKNLPMAITSNGVRGNLKVTG